MLGAGVKLAPFLIQQSLFLVGKLKKTKKGKTAMTMYQVLCLIGAPSFIGAMVGAVISKLNSNKALKNGVQALLRDRLLCVYNLCQEKGYADINERLNFENMYENYHTLGANGVMDDIHEKFKELPTDKE